MVCAGVKQEYTTFIQDLVPRLPDLFNVLKIWE